MLTCLRATALGVLCLLPFGCQRDRPLGELESGAGQAGDAGTTGNGGTTSGSANGGSVNGGSANGGSANGGSAEGGASTGGLTNGGSATGGSANGGSDNGGSDSGGSANGGGTGENCFSPDNRPERALDLVVQGCDCTSDDVDQCIMVPDAPWPHLIGMSCRDGRWSTVEDGPCEYGQTHPWGCMIENRVFKQNMPAPPDFLCRICAWCPANFNAACDLILCLPPECPTGTVQGSRCRICGMGPGGCDIEEHGCFEPCANDDDCEDGFRCLEEGFCETASPCI